MNAFDKTCTAALCFTYITAIATPMALAQEAAQPTATPTGESKSGKTKILETGAKLFTKQCTRKGI